MHIITEICTQILKEKRISVCKEQQMKSATKMLNLNYLLHDIYYDVIMSLIIVALRESK